MSYETNNITDDRELDWEEEILNEANSFTLLPDGDYPCTILKMERARYDGSAKVPPCRMAKLTVAVHGGELGENTVTYNLFLLQRFAWKIAEVFVSCGLASPEDERVRMQWDRLEGAACRCRIVQEDYTKKSGPHAGETGTANRITKFLPPAVQAAAPAADGLRYPAFASGVAAPSQKTDRGPSSASAVSAAGSASAAQQQLSWQKGAF